MRTPALWFFASLSLACADPPRPIAPPHARSASPAVTTAPTSEPEAPKEPETTERPPLPKLDTPELDAQLAFLSSICAPAVKRDSSGAQRVGCMECIYDSQQQNPFDGTVAMEPDTFFALQSLVYGSFTKAGADEAAASLDGCESHAENWGGTVLAERKAGAWSMARYDSGLHPDSCVAFRRGDDRDLLICRWVDGHQSYWHDQIFSYDFAAGDLSKGWSEILTMEDDLVPHCGGPAGQAVTSGRVEEYKLIDLDKDGDKDLQIVVSHRKGRVNTAYNNTCKKLFEALDKEGAPPVDLGAVLGRPQISTLDLVFNGAIFVPTPKSQKLISSF